jgi:hypothetical protein
VWSNLRGKAESQSFAFRERLPTICAPRDSANPERLPRRRATLEVAGVASGGVVDERNAAAHVLQRQTFPVPLHVAQVVTLLPCQTNPPCEPVIDVLLE